MGNKRDFVNFCRFSSGSGIKPLLCKDKGVSKGENPPFVRQATPRPPYGNRAASPFRGVRYMQRGIEIDVQRRPRARRAVQ